MERMISDLLPLQAGKLSYLFKTASILFEKWGYFPVIPSLYEHTLSNNLGEDIRKSLQKEITAVIKNQKDTRALPARYWYGGPVINSDKKGGKKNVEMYEMGIECIGAEGLLAEAEIITIVIELLRTFGIRDFRLVLGNQLFLQGLSDEDTKGAKKKVFLLRGDEDMIHQAQSFSSSKKCATALEDLKVLGRLVREFGHKEIIHYDLNPFLNPEEFDTLIFRIESGQHIQKIISGGRRRISDIETSGWVFDVAQLMEVINQVGTPLPSPKIDFLLVNRKQSRRSTFEVMRVLREHGYSVALDHSDKSRDELLEYAGKSGILNLLVIGDEEAALNEVRLIDVTDRIGTKIPIAEIFDMKSGINKLLRYHKRLELEQ